jgi:hypothetical protein
VMISMRLPAWGNTPHGLSRLPQTMVSSVVTLFAETILSPAMIVHALGARTVRGN